jgi:hypothetical protein
MRVEKLSGLRFRFPVDGAFISLNQAAMNLRFGLMRTIKLIQEAITELYYLDKRTSGRNPYPGQQAD